MTRFATLIFIFILLAGCCQNQLNESMVNAVHSWDNVSRYLNAALIDVVSGEFPSLERPVPFQTNHFCLTGKTDDEQKALHLGHLERLAKTENLMSGAFSKLADKIKCGN